MGGGGSTAASLNGRGRDAGLGEGRGRWGGGDGKAATMAAVPRPSMPVPACGKLGGGGSPGKAVCRRRVRRWGGGGGGHGAGHDDAAPRQPCRRCRPSVARGVWFGRGGAPWPVQRWASVRREVTTPPTGRQCLHADWWGRRGRTDWWGRRGRTGSAARARSRGTRVASLEEASVIVDKWVLAKVGWGSSLRVALSVALCGLPWPPAQTEQQGARDPAGYRPVGRRSSKTPKWERSTTNGICMSWVGNAPPREAERWQLWMGRREGVSGWGGPTSAFHCCPAGP